MGLSFSGIYVLSGPHIVQKTYVAVSTLIPSVVLCCLACSRIHYHPFTRTVGIICDTSIASHCSLYSCSINGVVWHLHISLSSLCLLTHITSLLKSLIQTDDHLIIRCQPLLNINALDRGSYSVLWLYVCTSTCKRMRHIVV